MLPNKCPGAMRPSPSSPREEGPGPRGRGCRIDASADARHVVAVPGPVAGLGGVPTQSPTQSPPPGPSAPGPALPVLIPLSDVTVTCDLVWV